jgi:hypothetical protein
MAGGVGGSGNMQILRFHSDQWQNGGPCRLALCMVSLPASSLPRLPMEYRGWTTIVIAVALIVAAILYFTATSMM